MVVRNEEKLIAQAICSVKPIVDEIVVVDTGSTDQTRLIAKRLGAKVVKHKWKNSDGEARNVYLRHAGGKWILVLDADERVSAIDLPRLRKLTQNKNVAAYIMPMRNYTRTHNLLREWRVLRGKYPKEEKFSRCPGFSTTYPTAFRLFRKDLGVQYDEAHTFHTYYMKFSRDSKRNIKYCSVPIHHFEFLKGRKFISAKQGRYLKLEQTYADSAKDNPWAYFNIGISLYGLKQDKKALVYLKKAIQVDNKFDMAYCLLGMVYRELGLYAQAVKSLKKAIVLNSRYADAWAVLGAVFEAQGKLNKAKDALRKAIQLNSDHVVARNMLGIVYERQGLLRHAQKQYRKAVVLNPFFTEARYNLADLRSKSTFYPSLFRVLKNAGPNKYL